MVTAQQRRRAVEYLKSRNVSEWRACRIVGFSRAAIWRPLHGRDDAALRSELKALAEKYLLCVSKAEKQHVKGCRDIVTASLKTAQRPPEFLLWHRGKKLRDHDDGIPIELKNRIQARRGARR